MAEKKEGSLDRRQFMIITAGGLGCLALGGVKDALARAQQTGKPVLTDKALNDLINKLAANPDAYAKSAQAAKADLFKFLSANFTLTEAQSFAIKNLSADNLKPLHEGIDASVEAVRAHALTKEAAQPTRTASWTPLTIAFKGEATVTKGKLDVHFYHKESDQPGGGHGSETGGSVSVEY